MNAESRKRLKQAAALLDQANEIIEEVLDDERDLYLSHADSPLTSKLDEELSTSISKLDYIRGEIYTFSEDLGKL